MNNGVGKMSLSCECKKTKALSAIIELSSALSDYNGCEITVSEIIECLSSRTISEEQASDIIRSTEYKLAMGVK